MGWMVSMPELAGMFITRLSIFSYCSISCYLSSLPVYLDFVLCQLARLPLLPLSIIACCYRGESHFSTL